MMREEEFKELCEELGGVFVKSKDSIKCIFPRVTSNGYSVL